MKHFLEINIDSPRHVHALKSRIRGIEIANSTLHRKGGERESNKRLQPVTHSAGSTRCGTVLFLFFGNKGGDVGMRSVPFFTSLPLTWTRNFESCGNTRELTRKSQALPKQS
uniref:Uncharacterized protein n=1 Tax=Timema genevievae TaxID=629358 RepID=A0A7R9K6Y1_TIMGE|nr:unnamed protein product [Timema genevievae]